MEQPHYIYFIYGMCFMFYAMMTWLFWRKRTERLSRFVMVLMAVIALQCLKDLFFLDDYVYLDTRMWRVMTSVDSVAVPLYAFILMELCHPGMVTRRMIAAQMLPVVILPALYIATGSNIFYFLDTAYVAIYGVGYAVWTIFAIRRYNLRLHQQFSYEENINLNWLRIILVFFFMILSLWILDCLHINADIESAYMLGSLVMWMFLAYFIYRHQNVIGELKISSSPALNEETAEEETERAPEEGESALARKIRELFEEEKIYLNPNLKLADIARMTGTNRTYVSRFFNEERQTTFFDYVNTYRVEHAKRLLAETDEKLDSVAEQSGFNSRQSLHRVFTRMAGESPERYRTKH